MRRSGKGSGGGIGMNKHVERRAPKVEPRANAYRPQGVSQYGNMVGNHVTSTLNTDYRGEPKRGGRGYEPPVGPTDNVAACGVGGGRKTYSSGSQSTWGDVSPGSPRPNTYRDALEQE
jgi:hypothetical protein